MKKSKPAWQIRVEYFGFLLLYKTIHALSFRAALNLSAFFFQIFYYGYWRSRRRALSHLLYTGVAKNRSEAKKIAKECYREYSKLLVEVVKMDQMYDPKKFIVTGDEETIRKITSPDGVTPAEKNVIFVTAHYGNWEIAATAGSDKTKRSFLAVMRPFSNPLIGNLIMAHRMNKSLELVSKDSYGTVFKLLHALRDGKNVALLIDQHVTRKEGVENLFFGQLCRTHVMPALLHLKTGIPLVPMLTRRTGDDFSFAMEIAPMIEYQSTGDKDHDIQAICQICTSALEKMIAQHPEQWLWVHRRWMNINRKRRKPTAVSGK